MPGIDIGLLDPGTKVLLGTDLTIFELVVVEPHEALVDVSSNDPHLKRPKRGKLLGSSNDITGKQIKAEWIGEGMYMNLQFRNLTLVTRPLVSARLEGKSRISGRPWFYEVF